MDISSTDWAIRTAAFGHVRRLSETRDQLTSSDLKLGFQFNGERLPLINPQRGIFKPRQMDALLSIKTVFPSAGKKVWYDDQRNVHKQIYDGEETIDYSFMGTDQNAPDNRWLREAMEQRVPIIYFLGVSPAKYEPAGTASFRRHRSHSVIPPPKLCLRRHATRLRGDTRCDWSNSDSTKHHLETP
jgi:putative restriction endonuclease